MQEDFWVNFKESLSNTTAAWEAKHNGLQWEKPDGCSYLKEKVDFHFDGSRLHSDQTPEGHGMEDGDAVDVSIAQVGC